MIKLPEYFKINNYVINSKNKQLFYKSIYSLESIKFKTLKIYIETKFASSFIKILKLQASKTILA